MKRIICLILCLLMLCGCTQKENTPTQPVTTAPQTEPSTTATEPTVLTEATEPTEETVPVMVYPNPLAAISLPLIEHASYAQDGTLLCTYTGQDVTVALQDPLVAQAITEDLLYRTYSYPMHSIFLAAQADYTGQSDWTPYQHSILYSPARIDQTVLSLYGQQVIHTDTPYATAAGVSVNYSTTTGRALTLWDVLTEDYSADALCAAIVDALQSQSVAATLYPDHSNIITDLFSTNTAMEHWFFTQKGLCFYFDPYEIAPHSAGTILAEVPYAQMAGILKDDYFPTEEIAYRGDVIFTDFERTNIDQFQQFAEVVFDTKAAQHLLYTNGTLLNVRLEIGTWTEDTFTPDAVVFAAEALTAGDALMVQMPEDSLAQLRWGHVSGGETSTTAWIS